MSTNLYPTLNKSGIFYQQAQYNAQSHISKRYMPAVMNMPDSVKDLGPVEYWAQSRKAETPLYKMSNFGGQNVIEHFSPYYKFTVPTSIDEVAEIVQDITTTDKPGLDGQPFEIMVSQPLFGKGDELKTSQWSPYTMVVHPSYPIRVKGDATVYTVVLKDNGQKFMDKKLLSPGNKIGKFGSLIGPEFGQEYSQWLKRSVSEREYILYIGNASVNTSYWISNEANKYGVTLANYMDKVIEYYQIDGFGDPTVTNLPKFMSSKNLSKDEVMKKVSGYAFATKMDDISMRMLWIDYQNQLMWGTGGKVMLDGQEDIVTPVGLWQQLNSGYVYTYNYGSFSIDLFKQMFYNYYIGKKDFSMNGTEPVVEVETGFAGMQLINDAIKKEVSNSTLGMIINAKEIGALTGEDAMNLGWGYAFNKITFRGVVTIKFVYNPAYDNINQANEIENPMVNGYRLSSYSFIMYDVDDNKNNIFLLKNQASQVKMRIENGRSAHPMTELNGMAGVTAFQSSSRKSGFGVTFEKPCDAIWVKDPTRVLKLVMVNPVTGLPFGGLI